MTEMEVGCRVFILRIKSPLNSVILDNLFGSAKAHFFNLSQKSQPY